MKIIAFDIETGKADNYKDFMPEFKEPKDKRSKSIEEQQTEWESKLALSPLTGKILAIGFYFNDIDNLHLLSEENSEADIISLFWDNYTEAKADCFTLVGHNIKKFDLPFIIRRGLLYGIRPPINLAKDKYRLDFFEDTLELWGQGNYKDEYTSLDTLARFFKVGKKDSVINHKNGETFEKYFLSPMGNDKQIAIDYLVNDLKITYEVAKKILM